MENHLRTQNQIELIDRGTGTVLAKFPFDQEDKAYKEAEQFEAMGIDIEWRRPSVAETLAIELGKGPEHMANLKAELHAEVESHNELPESCCYQAEGHKPNLKND